MVYGAQNLQGPATLADIEALPETIRGEIIDGTLYIHPLPDPRHGYVVGALLAALRTIGRSRTLPSESWWIIFAPGIQARGSPEFVPDIAGWRQDRFPVLPEERWTEAPDWACEILSPTTRSYDQRIKRPFYARIGVRHLWYVDLEARTLTVSELTDGRWVELGVYGEDDVIRAAPFDAIELKLGELWPPLRTP
ncbi:Uma2 family endonuclease [Hyalangium rubrum]|uniref:Uma2 family endonuclease n=1 Tax=Hyalangium rubrum TaxID=3103134 RepID=A0ABU5H2C7_9BACT|nr:Uma2 family endonuclease [Hyalangium sp. s54d21]MDY7227630.1 Uma2 family endonuclease [Hyalangium sp. s54d21]